MRPQIGEPPEAEQTLTISWDSSPARIRLPRPVLPPELCVAAAVVLALGIGISISSEAGSEGTVAGILRTLHRAPVEGLALAADGRSAASVSRDGTVLVWDVNDPRESRVIARSRAGFSSVAFAPDGRALVAGGLTGEVKVLDPAHSGAATLMASRHSQAVRCVAFAPDGASVASGGDDRTVRVWDLHSGRERFALEGHAGFVQQLAFAPNGRGLASVGLAGDLILWDLSTGRLLQRFETGDLLSSVAFSPDGRTLVLGGNSRILLHDLATGRSWTYSAQQGKVTALRVLSDGTTLVSSGMNGSIALWEIGPSPGMLRPGLSQRGHLGGVKALAVTLDGTRILSGGNDDAVRLWSLSTTRPAEFLSPSF